MIKLLKSIIENKSIFPKNEFQIIFKHKAGKGFQEYVITIKNGEDEILKRTTRWNNGVSDENVIKEQEAAEKFIATQVLINGLMKLKERKNENFPDQGQAPPPR